MNGSDIAPLAKKLAEENNVDWQHLPGSGPEGRVVERDVLEYLAKVMAGEEALDPTPEPLPDGIESWSEDEVAAFSPLGETDVDLEGFQAEVSRANSYEIRDDAPTETPDNTFDEGAPFADIAPFDSAEETSFEEIAAIDAELPTDASAYDDDRIEVDLDEADAADDMMSAHDVELDTADEPAIREDIFLFDDDDTEAEFSAADESGFDTDLSQAVSDGDSDNPWTLPDDHLAENADDAAAPPFAPVFTAEDNLVEASPTGLSDSEVDFADDPFADEVFADHDDLADDNELIIAEDEEALIDDIDAVPPEEVADSEDDGEASIASEFHETAANDNNFIVADDEESAETDEAEDIFAETPEEDDGFDETVVTEMDQADVVTDFADSAEAEAQLEPTESSIDTEDTTDDFEELEEAAASEGGDEWVSHPEDKDLQASEGDLTDETTAGVAVASVGLAGASLSEQTSDSEPSQEQEVALEETDEAVAAFPPSSLPLVSYGLLLRRHLDLTTLLEAQLAVGREFDEGTPIAPTAFLLRAAAKALKTVGLGDDHSVGLAIISRHGLGVKQLAMGPTFAELLESLSEAQNSESTTQEDTGLVVADMSAFDVDEAVLGLGAPVLTLGRILFDSTEGRYRTTLSLSGEVEAEAGAKFLGRVAELLSSPVQLVI